MARQEFEAGLARHVGMERVLLGCFGDFGDKVLEATRRVGDLEQANEMKTVTNLQRTLLVLLATVAILASGCVTPGKQPCFSQYCELNFKVVTYPPGAWVYANGELKGKAPISFSIPAGKNRYVSVGGFNGGMWVFDEKPVIEVRSAKPGIASQKRVINLNSSKNVPNPVLVRFNMLDEE